MNNNAIVVNGSCRSDAHGKPTSQSDFVHRFVNARGENLDYTVKLFVLLANSSEETKNEISNKLAPIINTELSDDARIEYIKEIIDLFIPDMP